VDPYRIDQALEEFGMPMGVFKMCDLSGLDVFLYVGQQYKAYSDRTHNSTLLQYLVKANRLGNTYDH
jgi:enoyl-CoA hydratase/3-hydroxyacyl-CoA dehydrogenase